MANEKEIRSHARGRPTSKRMYHTDSSIGSTKNFITSQNQINIIIIHEKNHNSLQYGIYDILLHGTSQGIIVLIKSSIEKYTSFLKIRLFFIQ
jgi:hypothetical protein